jgi:hypothetical protein
MKNASMASEWVRVCDPLAGAACLYGFIYRSYYRGTFFSKYEHDAQASG